MDADGPRVLQVGVRRRLSSGMDKVLHGALKLPDKWAQLEAAVPSSPRATSYSPKPAAADRRAAPPRRVLLGPGAKNAGAAPNAVATAKYNVVTFLPLFLFSMFTRAAYLYFLSQAALAWWSTVSPFAPFGPTLALSFVLSVAAAKAIAEDRKRAAEDRRVNNSTARVVTPDGGVRSVKWRAVRVGDILEVRDGEDFPADLVCLSVDAPDGVCYIRTTNLDGESNLKVRRPADLRAAAPRTRADAAALVALLTCEPPNNDLHHFAGRIVAAHPANDAALPPCVAPLTMTELLLRGCTLRNSGSVRGVVVYAGPESRVQQNAAPPPRKLGSFDRFLNVQISLLLALQVVLCASLACASYGWKVRAGTARPHLALTSDAEGNYVHPASYIGVLFFSFWILLSYMVPISLFVTMEIVKFVLCSVFVSRDAALADPESGDPARARNSDIVEDLGQVRHVFSDKTGTLTSNDMRLRRIAVKGVPYGGDATAPLETLPSDTPPSTALAAFDARLARAAAVMRDAGFWADAAAAGGSDADVLALATSSPGPGEAATSPGLAKLASPRASPKDGPGARPPSAGVGGASPPPLLTPAPAAARRAALAAGGGDAGSTPAPPGGRPPLPPGAAAAAAASAAAAATPLSPPATPADVTAAVLGHHVLDFWTNVCLCHSLIVERPREEGEEEGAAGAAAATDGAATADAAPSRTPSPAPPSLPAYQGPSPDEVALADAARRLGFEFVSRSRTSVALRMQGHDVTHDLLNVLDFTSDRARMSVVTRAPDGTIRLHCKGSDAALLPRLRAGTDARLLGATQDNLTSFSSAGLRTLLLASRVVPEAEWAAWNATHAEAAASLAGRDAALARAADAVERDLELVGVTAIEDKLQEGVPAAIATLKAAGVKVWMITGDKQETAVNVGVACALIADPRGAVRLNAGSPEAAAAALEGLLASTAGGGGDAAAASVAAPSTASPAPPPPPPLELVVDGRTLGHILGRPLPEAALAALAGRAASVVVCRASPSQKAAVVGMMKRDRLRRSLAAAGVPLPADGSLPSDALAARAARWLRSPLRTLRSRTASNNECMLAIGDGANDVAMLQAADIGVGLLGKEGRQAANNADFAFGRFASLTRLMLVHGSLADYRLSRLIKYSFYKNVAFAAMLFAYQFFNGFSGQALLDGVTSAFYNAFFTALPAGLFAGLDRPVRSLATLASAPRAYNARPALTARAFWRTAVGTGALHGAVTFFVPYLSMRTRGADPALDDVWAMGKTMFIGIIGVVSLEIALVARFWTWPFAAATLGSYFGTWPWLALLPLLYRAAGKWDVAQAGVGVNLLSAPLFWLQLALIYLLTFSSRLAERGVVWLYRPRDDMVLAEMEAVAEGEGTAKAAGGGGGGANGGDAKA